MNGHCSHCGKAVWRKAASAPQIICQYCRQAARAQRSRYDVYKIYVIICSKCNEDITRPQAGEDVTSRAEADQAIRDHERTFHAG